MLVLTSEDSPSGLWRTLGKRVGCKPSGVRIPHPPRVAPVIVEIPGFFVATLEHPNILPSASPPAASSFGKVAAASVVVILYS